MKVLVWLFTHKKLALLRHILNRPRSICILITVMACFTAGMSAILHRVEYQVLTDRVFEQILFLIMALTLLIIVVFYLPTKREIFSIDDYCYVLNGPFTNRKVLSYLLMDCGLSALIISSLTVFIIKCSVLNVKIPRSLMIHIFLATVFAFYFIICLMDYLYLKDRLKGRKVHSPFIALIIFIIIISSLLCYAFFHEGFFLAGISRFMSDGLFYLIPAAGWQCFVISGIYSGHQLYALIGYILLVGSSTLISCLLIRLKGHFTL